MIQNYFKFPLIHKYKSLCAKPSRYIPKCYKKSVTRERNLTFIRVIKNSSFDYINLIQILLKDLEFPSQKTELKIRVTDYDVIKPS